MFPEEPQFLQASLEDFEKDHPGFEIFRLYATIEEQVEIDHLTDDSFQEAFDFDMEAHHLSDLDGATWLRLYENRHTIRDLCDIAEQVQNGHIV